MTKEEIDLMQQKNKALTNPELLEIIREIKKSGNPNMEHQEKYVNALMKARMIVPVAMQPEPSDFNKTRVQFSHLTNKEGKKFLMAFTDMETLLKNIKDDGKLQVLGLTYADFGKVLSVPENKMNGFVINPFTENIIIGPEQARAINNIVTTKKVRDGELAMIKDNSDISDEKLRTIEKYLEESGKATKAYSLSMVKGQTTSRLIIVDLIEGNDFQEFAKTFGEEILKPIEEKEHPFVVMPYTEKVAQAATKESVPFFVKL